MVVRKYTINRNVFLNEDHISYYLLGAFMADGTVSNVKRSKFVSLYSKDIDWLLSIRNLVSPNKPIYNKKIGISEFKISDLITLNWFIDKGCVPNKSLSLRMPNIPERYLPDFVRGYFDGDGSASISKYKVQRRGKYYSYHKFGCYICSGSEEFIKGLHQSLIKNRFSPSLHQTKKTKSFIGDREINGRGTWRVSFGDRSAIKFTNWTHYDGHKISMKRKHNIITKARDIWRNK